MNPSALRSSLIPSFLALFAVLLSLGITPGVRGQDDDKDAAVLLNDFIHYALVAKPDLAAAYAQALLDSGISSADLALMIDDGRDNLKARFDDAVRWGQAVPELEAIVAEVALRVEQGRLDLARNPDRILEAIDMLIGTQRQKMIAQRRLEEAGEYAVPALLRAITEGRDERLKLASGVMLKTIGRQAVTPLCIALPHIDEVSQRVICDILGEIGFPHAGPVLREIALDDGAAGPVRNAASRAFSRVGGMDVDLSTLYGNLARRYFNDVSALIAFPYESTNSVWSYDAFIGLVATPTPTEIYGEVMAMTHASHAVSLDEANQSALALFIAANLRRENDLPDDAADPIFGTLPYSPDFYATVYGTRAGMDVLSLALDRTDTPLVRDAIAALAKTTGGSNLFSQGAGRTPLVAALTYPDRRVQYEAALALGRTLPDRRFDGDANVVPLLSSAVSNSGASWAVVIADDEEDRRTRAKELELNDFVLAGAEANVASLQTAIANSVGIDLVIIQKPNPESARQTLADLRLSPRAMAAPVMLLVPSADMEALKREFFNDPRVMVTNRGAQGAAFSAALDELMNRAVGGMMSDTDAEIYAIESLETLHDIAIHGSATFPIAVAEPALREALNTRTGGLRLLVADILALISSDRAQQALFDAAIAATDEGEKIDLLDRVTASVRQFGNRAEAHQIDAIQDLVMTTTDDLAEAAARVHGALNLPNMEAVKLLPGADKD